MKNIIPFKGEPVWLGSNNVTMLLLPIKGKPTKADLESMALDMDKDKDGNCEYFLKKMTKEELLKNTKHQFDCAHDWILVRMVKKEGEDFRVIIPPDDDNRLKINLTYLPKGTIGDLPVQWVSHGKQEKN